MTASELIKRLVKGAGLTLAQAEKVLAVLLGAAEPQEKPVSRKKTAPKKAAKKTVKKAASKTKRSGAGVRKKSRA